MGKRYCLALDLHNDSKLIEEYKQYHAPGKAWPEITESIKSAGILDMQIYCIGNRLFMIMDVGENFSFDSKANSDKNNLKVGAWEDLMWKYQVPLPWAKQGEKWVLMEEIYRLP